jgi:Amt family ammonium transporter
MGQQSTKFSTEVLRLLAKGKLVTAVALTMITGLVFAPAAAIAQDGAFDGANTAWILTATALVLFMTLPGLALFYGGLVRSNNVLSVLMHCFAIACLMSILWLVGAYSIAFGDGGAHNQWWGGFGKAMLSGIGTGTTDGNLPETVFFMFQMTFAIITPALIVGAYPERIKFGAVLIFSALWLFLVYAPVTHWVWGGGWLADRGVMDFAGGIVVHATAGTAALVLAIVLGARRGFPSDLAPPHNPGLTMAGAAMLWVGWYGFNAGSALAADGAAGMAMTVTHISAATAAFTWMLIEWIKLGKPSLIGTVTGAIAGLATITPASGYVGPLGGLAFGVASGVICYVAVQFIKQKLKIDDSLDVFAVHGVGGILGTLLAAIFASEALGGLGYGEGVTMGSQFTVQLTGVVAVVVYTAIVSFVIIKVTQAISGLRASEDDETIGLDLSEHGERGYSL